MRRLAALLAGFLVLVGIPPVHAAETGRIEGRVVNGTTGRPQAGVEIRLTRGGPEETREETVVSDERGRYAFEDLPTGEERFYAIDAFYKGGLFAGRPLLLPDDTTEPPVIETTLRVFEPTTDPNAILIRRNDMFLLHAENRISVIEAVKVVNPTKSAYIGRGSAFSASDEGDPIPSLGFALPAGAIPETFTWQEADLDVPEAVELEGLGFGITSAIPPGELDFTFTYQVEGTGGTFDLSRRALYEISEMSVFVADPLELESHRLEPEGELNLEGRTYRRFSSTEPLAAAEPLQLSVIAQSGTSLPLVLGLVAAILVALTAGLVGYRRAKRPRPGPPTTGPSREETVTAIAALDLRHSNGEVADDEYRAERERLKSLLTSGRGSNK